MVLEVNYTMEYRNSIEPTGVDIPGKMVDFILAVAQDGWSAANGWNNGPAELTTVSLTGED